jgi:hypothetical protein
MPVSCGLGESVLSPSRNGERARVAARQPDELNTERQAGGPASSGTVTLGP